MDVRIELTYKTKKGIETFLNSETMRADQALVVAHDLLKTGRVKSLQFLDQHDNSWNVKEMTTYLEEVETEPHHINLYFDGGFNRETYSAGLGVVIYYEQNKKRYRLRKNALVEGLTSNNEAEYAALHLGLKELELLGAHHIPVTFVGDSMVVINQLTDEWPVYEEELTRWLDRIEAKLELLGMTPEFELVSRNQNKEADQLATQALNGVDILSKKQLDSE